MRVAVIGAGVAGLTAAYTLSQAGTNVVLYEKDNHVGGHAYTVDVDDVSVDVGFMVFNRVTYPNMVTLFQELGVETEESDMSFGISLDQGRGCEWGSKSLSGLFAQKRNAVNPFFLRMIKEIVTFKQDVLNYLDRLDNSDPAIDKNETLGRFLDKHGYSKKFKDCYIVPVCASIWSCSSETVLDFSAASILKFCRNHHLLQIFGRPQWLTVKGRSKTYVNKIVSTLESLGAEIRTNCGVAYVSSTEEGVQVVDERGLIELFDSCLVAAHAPDALEMLGEGATFEERSILGAFQYSTSDIYLHRDDKLMPRNPRAWAAWNFLGDIGGRVCVTYWLNTLQNLGDTGLPILATLNPANPPKHIVFKWKTSHPIPSPAAAAASGRLTSIQGKRHIWFCGAYQGYGFHEDGLKAGLVAAKSLLGEKFEALRNMKQMVPSWSEFAARIIVTTFLRRFVQTGHIQLLEDGGTVIDFIGGHEGCYAQCTLQVHSPAFYWKVAARADLGLADAFIDGDYTVVDRKNGLLNLFLILIANRDFNKISIKIPQNSRGWWSPLLLTSAVDSSISYLRHALRQNSLTNARRNISQHYDLSNDLFALFLDETMTYSCAIFKGPEEPLLDAQLRKLNYLINKARIESNHEVLEIGFGWGSLALAIVRRTGCKYTGITLSKEQLKYAQDVVRKAGLEDNITLKLCDYRSLPGYHKYDRILSCEMLEAVGHEYYEEFFRRCDHLLAKDGLLVVQVISMPEERYDTYRRSSDFIKEYIFPGGCTPSFSALTAAMSAGSSLCVEHMENIGVHYSQTLLCWRDRFLANRGEIQKLGFSEKFLRMWHYYFDYCAAGFKTCTLGNLQIVFSRSGNISVLGDASEKMPSI